MCSLWILAPVASFISTLRHRNVALFWFGCEARTSGEIILVPLAEFS